MQKSRVEAFSDAVIAIIITIMVLELKAPKYPTFSALLPLLPVFFCYVLSFVYLATFWNNHHHLLYTVNHINGAVLWANIHLLFWLSLIPFVTAWAGELKFANLPTALYGFVLFMSSIAYFIVTHTLMQQEGKQSILSKAIGKDKKGKISILLYASAMFLSIWVPKISFAIYILVAIIWAVPDSRIAEQLRKRNK